MPLETGMEMETDDLRSKQALNHVEPFRRRLLLYNELYGSEDNDKSLSLSHAMSSLLHDMWMGSNALLTPYSVFDSLCAAYPMFIGHRQHDAHECLRLVLERVEVEMNSREGAQDPAVADVFRGKLHSSVTCRDCGTDYEKDDEFQDLSLEISNAIYLHKDEDDQWSTRDCHVRGMCPHIIYADPSQFVMTMMLNPEFP